MQIPEFLANGDLPPEVYSATKGEFVERFGQQTPQRQHVTGWFLRVYELATGAGKLHRFIVFGSYVTAKPDPKDVDIILVMRDDFCEEDYTPELLPILDHMRAQRELGASVFWIRTGAILGGTIDEFIERWQITRDGTKRGIIEVVAEAT